MTAPHEAPPALATHDLAVGYRLGRRPPRTVLSGLSLSLRPGEFCCLLGPNGAGKSTLLRTVAGTQAALEGRVEIGGADLRQLGKLERSRRLSLVLTERPQVGIMSVYDLVGLGRYPHTGWGGRLSRHDHAVIRWAIEAAGCGGLAGRDVGELSDGERQRTMIARALAQEPRVMLLDEPTAFLDLPRRVELTGLLRRLARETGLAVLLSTHDLDLAIRTADTVWLVTEGGKVHTGAPEELALGGAFAAAFTGADLVFDDEAGGFRARGAPVGRAVVVGEGLRGLWTRRALEREGFVVVSGPDQEGHDLIVRCDDGGGWSVTPGRSGGEERVGSLSHLLDLIRPA